MKNAPNFRLPFYLALCIKIRVGSHIRPSDICCLAFFLFRARISQRFKAQGAEHGVRRAGLGVRLQVGVDVGGRAEIAVPEPFLNLLHGNMVVQQQAGAGRGSGWDEARCA